MACSIPDSPEARKVLFDHVARLEQAPGFGAPTDQMLADFGVMLDQGQSGRYKVDRGLADCATSLGQSLSRIRAWFSGKTILDVGCGVGTFSAEVAEDRTTSVIALDSDPSVLGRVPHRPNLRTVVGSGYELDAVFRGEQFDIVVASFSTLFWARTPAQAENAIASALGATKPGGQAVFIPVLQHPKNHEAYHAALASGNVPGYTPDDVPEDDLRWLGSCLAVEDVMRSTRLHTLESLEQAGRIACAYRASNVNRQHRPIAELFGPLHPSWEDFSVVATVS